LAVVAAEETMKLRIAAQEKARAFVIERQQVYQRLEENERMFYETSTGAETKRILLQDKIHETYVYKMWIGNNSTIYNYLSPHELYSQKGYIKSHTDIRGDVVSHLATIGNIHPWHE